MVGFQMYPCSHQNYIFVTKIPTSQNFDSVLTILKNNDNSPLNDTVVIESTRFKFFWLSLNISYYSGQIVLPTKNNQVPIFVP